MRGYRGKLLVSGLRLQAGNPREQSMFSLSRAPGACGEKRPDSPDARRKDLRDLLFLGLFQGGLAAEADASVLIDFDHLDQHLVSLVDHVRHFLHPVVLEL